MCARHWNSPANPVDFEQREGRVHRFGGHAIQRNVANRHRAGPMLGNADDVHGGRLLPCDVEVIPKASLGDVLKEGRPPAPPSYDELEAAGLVASDGDPDRWFSPEEQLTASWLRERGLDVLSVRRREGRQLKTPDAVAAAFRITIETKRAVATTNAIVQQTRKARWQAGTA